MIEDPIRDAIYARLEDALEPEEFHSGAIGSGDRGLAGWEIKIKFSRGTLYTRESPHGHHRISVVGRYKENDIIVQYPILLPRGADAERQYRVIKFPYDEEAIDAIADTVEQIRSDPTYGHVENPIRESIDDPVLLQLKQRLRNEHLSTTLFSDSGIEPIYKGEEESGWILTIRGNPIDIIGLYGRKILVQYGVHTLPQYLRGTTEHKHVEFPYDEEAIDAIIHTIHQIRTNPIYGHKIESFERRLDLILEEFTPA